MYRRGHTGVTLLLSAPLIFALIWRDPSHIPLILYATLIASATTHIPDKDMQWKNITVPVTDKSRFVLWGMLKGFYAHTKSFLPGHTRPHITSKALVKHRGFTHTVWFAAAVGFVVGILHHTAFTYIALINPVTSIVGVPPIDLIAVYSGGGAALGIIFHFAGDILTYSGVKPFGSLPPAIDTRIPGTDLKLALGVCSADNRLWNGGLAVSGVIAVLFSLLFSIPETRNVIGNALIELGSGLV